jgi:hypothetical protein
MMDMRVNIERREDLEMVDLVGRRAGSRPWRAKGGRVMVRES